LGVIVLPREFFPKMPDEAFNIWLAPLIDEIGWPFLQLDSDISGTRWETLLANITLDRWHAFDWELRHVVFTPRTVAHSSLMKIDCIHDHCVRNAYTLTANLQNTKERFRACAEFFATHGRIPLPVVAIPRHGRLELVDGHHRIAALRKHGQLGIYPVPVYSAF
jgi:hypothetical protein